MQSARAFAPGNISGIFKIIPHEDPRQMHSLGMGFTVGEGVTATVAAAAAVGVSFNGEDVDFPTVAAVVAQLGKEPLRVALESPLPLSCGFGLSGASALATAYAIGRLHGLGLTPRQLAMTAHVAEVENLTGLGDVCAQFHGGCLAKLQPGDPLAAQVLAVAEQPIFYRYFSPISTSGVLRDQEARIRINAAADQALAGLAALVGQEKVDFDQCIRLARRFATQSGLLRDPDVKRLIAGVEADGGAASMIMLGNAVFSTRPFEGALETTLARQGAQVLD